MNVQHLEYSIDVSADPEVSGHIPLSVEGRGQVVTSARPCK
jgi:hypothetical protein